MQFEGTKVLLPILGSVQGSHLVEDIQEQESVLQQCINQLESYEETRTALVSLLKDALQNQVLYSSLKASTCFNRVCSSSVY